MDLLMMWIDVEPLKPWEAGPPQCPLHPQYGMCIKEIKTKYGLAQLHHCPHKECVIACFGDNEQRDEFIYQVDRSLHQQKYTSVSLKAVSVRGLSLVDLGTFVFKS